MAEVNVASDQISGVDTTTAAFIGKASAGAPSEPVLVTSFADYERVFGNLEGELTQAVRLFFENGGTRAYVIPAAARLAKAVKNIGDIQFALLAVPDASRLGTGEATKVVRAAEEVCERHRAFLLVDPPVSLATDDVEAWAGKLGAARNAAVYLPRLHLPDGNEAAASGAVAGVFARTDLERGVWKAPAGLGATVRGVADVTVALSESVVNDLTSKGVNVVRQLETGLVLWGARTRAVDESQWRYVNIRRLALFLERSIEEGTQWAVFEPSNESLWSKVRRGVETFMLTLFRAGAFGGATPEDAFFVRCDRTTMTQDDIDNGRLVILVGFAPLTPAEFTVLRIAWAAA